MADQQSAGESADRLEAEIAAARDDLARSVDALVDRVHPKKVAQRSLDSVKEKLGLAKHRSQEKVGELRAAAEARAGELRDATSTRADELRDATAARAGELREGAAELGPGGSTAATGAPRHAAELPPAVNENRLGPPVPPQLLLAAGAVVAVIVVVAVVRSRRSR